MNVRRGVPRAVLLRYDTDETRWGQLITQGFGQEVFELVQQIWGVLK